MKYLLLAMVLIFSVKTYCQQDTLVLTDSTRYAGIIYSYGDTLVSIKVDDINHTNRKIFSALVSRIVFSTGDVVYYHDGKMLANGVRPPVKQIQGFDSNGIGIIKYDANHYITKAKNNFIGAAVFGTISLVGISYNMLSRPDTAGYFAQPNKYFKQIEKWENRKRAFAIVSTASGVLGITFFLIGCAELGNAGPYLSTPADKPLSLQVYPTRATLVYRF
jgi:hypothetical protein